MSEWISNEGNKRGTSPCGCYDTNRKVKVKFRNGVESEKEVWKFWWADSGCASDIVSYQFVDEEDQEPKKYYSDWLSNKDNDDPYKPNPSANPEAEVEVVYYAGKTYSGLVSDLYWKDTKGEYAIEKYRYVYDEPPETFEEEPDTQDTGTTLKVLEVKEETNGDVTVQLQLTPEALKVLIEQGLRAIIKNTADAELQRIKDSTAKKGIK